MEKAAVQVDYTFHQELEDLLKKAVAESILSDGPILIQPLFGDGSDRRFYRIRQGKSHYIALVSPRRRQNGTDENDSYFLIGTHLFRCGIPVPRFLLSEPGRGWFLMEDVGDFHLQRLANLARVDSQSIYRQALRLLTCLHARASDGFEEDFCFDAAVYDPPFVYARELEYFREAFLNEFLHLGLSSEDLRMDFENLAEAAGVNGGTTTIMHRDFQSRNIMVHRGSLRLLDFQGMRFGPPAYDLASLLIDPYVILSRGEQEGLFELYWSSARRFLDCSYNRFRQSYISVRLCRNLQILGAYGYLGLVKGKRGFLRYIPRAWSQLREWVDGPCNGRYPKLRKYISRSRPEEIRTMF